MTDLHTLSPAVDAERHSLDRRAGPLSYYVAGDGRPALVIHSVNAAASVKEVAPTFHELARSHRVFAPDLPGFGFSDRSERRYNVELFVSAIDDMLECILENGDDTPVDAVALSLSSEFLARAAQQHPQRFRSLTLITPTGFNRGSDKLRDPEGSTRFMPALDALLSARLWRGALFRNLTRPSVVRYFLRRTYGSADIDHDLADYCIETARQPGAEFAPLAFLSGGLFSRDIRSVYESLELPVFLPHGTRGDFADFSQADWARQRHNWTLKAYPSGAMPQWELNEQFHRDLHNFYAGLDAP